MGRIQFGGGSRDIGLGLIFVGNSRYGETPQYTTLNNLQPEGVCCARNKSSLIYQTRSQPSTENEAR